MERRPRIVILGAGNVATHLALNFAKKADVVQIYNHRLDNAELLAEKVGASATDKITELDDTADLYIIAVKDDAISQIASQLRDVGFGVWVHTSGSTPADVLDGIGKANGVLYPLQTFSKDSEIKIEEVPFFIESSSENATETIDRIARMISPNIHHIDSEQRKRLHIAAVFACNFPNYLWTISDGLLKDDGLDISVFKSLITATIEKALEISPEKGQTGPARGGDKKIMDEHESMLSGEAADIYRILSEHIYNHYHKISL